MRILGFELKMRKKMVAKFFFAILFGIMLRNGVVTASSVSISSGETSNKIGN